MTETRPLNAPTSPLDDQVVPIVSKVPMAEERLGGLLAQLRSSAPVTAEGTASDAPSPFENRLALVRLGMATSLFYALRTKHAPTAAHCLRVAMSCSAWAQRLGLGESTRDRIEVAALLHDLGKIGVPDRILRKPGKLSVEEQLTIDRGPAMACEILGGCTSDPDLLNVIAYSNTWYDSRRDGEAPRGDALPMGSRMLAIANAFDAMTTDSVYRPAMSRERAIGELHSGSGTQFDPELVADFSRMLEQRPEMLHGAIVDRWLQQLRPAQTDSFWTGTADETRCHGEAVPASGSREETPPFFEQLTHQLHDGVAFTDSEGTITRWNESMTHLTGISADAIIGQSWSDEALRLRERDETRPESCLVTESIRCGNTMARPMQIEQPGKTPTPIHVEVSPVSGRSPGCLGAVVVIRDLSQQTDLEQRLASLYQKSTLDALTGVANRSHFDQTLLNSTESVANGGPGFSLIICDIDHFKRVNDIHGHPAGDEALIRFAEVLQRHSRDGDLVARYGGEEFLLLADSCDIATASRRAEAIRSSLERTSLPSLGGESVTASFGVTEFQAGDNAESVLARADRALLKAKDNGRNRVVQLGSGRQDDTPAATSKRGWLGWFESEDAATDSEFIIRTPVPVDLVIEKLRGFIADHHAEIINVDEDQVSLKVRATCPSGGRRRVDQHIALRARLTLSESKQSGSAPSGNGYLITNVHVDLQPIRNRDRRKGELSACIDQVIAGLRCYLVGEVERV